MNSEEISVWAQLYDLTAGMYLQEPTVERVSSLVPLADMIGTLLAEKSLSRLLAQAGETSMPTLRQEYYDLFTVPVSGRYLPPFESAQRESRLWGPLTHEVQAFYEETGFRTELLSISPCWNEMTILDHVGFELAFVGGLLRSATTAMDEEAKRALLATTMQFVERHLIRWLPDFGQKVQAHAETSFYQAVGLLTERLVPALQTGSEFYVRLV